MAEKKKAKTSSNGHCLTAQQIRDADDLPIERVDTPEWGKGNYVFVKTQTGKQRDAFEASCTDAKTGKVASLVNLRARIAVQGACDENGKPLFTKTDIDWLGNKSCAALERVVNVYQRLNHTSAEDIEELAKNSNGAQSADSGTS